jgi:hypothetical protein
VVAAIAATVSAWCAESDLAAHYDFDEGAGAVLRDQSGNGNDGRLHNAKWVKQGGGHCLELNGVDSYVDCGDGPSLDLRDVVTLEAWVYPSRRVPEEPGILGKHFSSYLLTYYKDGQCWWYIGEGGNNAKTTLTVGGWHHVACTFDGELMKLYLDGRLASSHGSRHKAINRGGRFLLGCVMGEPDATDPAYTRTAYFPGMIDEVSVWHRALTAEAVRARFDAGIRKLSLVAPFQPVVAQATLREGNTVVKAGASGGVQVGVGPDACLVGSSFSYPGKEIGQNHLGGGEARGEREWAPTVKRLSDRAAAISAGGAFYSLRRTVTLQPGKVQFVDELTNLRDVPTAVILENRLVAPESFQESFTVGGAENPTIFLRHRNGGLGVLQEDNVSRLQFEPCLGLPGNQAKFRVGSFALGARKRYTFRWTLYLLPKDEGYFDFMNRVRRDWNTNSTLEGPFSFFDVGSMSSFLDDPAALKAYLKRKHLKIVALSPWLDYDPGSFDRVWTREEYRERMQKAIRAFRQVDPAVKVVGSIETDWVTIYPERIPGGDRLPQAVAGQPRPSGRLTPEQTKIVDDADLPWKDSVKRDANGTLELELYARGDKPQTALSVYPAVGNYQYEFLLGQVKFLLDEVGCDGFYIDEFSQGWRGGQIRTYVGWDGHSVEVDPRTGEIERKYVDCSLAGVQARLNLCKYALERGKLVVANTYATAMEEQALPVQRFSETWGSFDPFAFADGEEPPACTECFRGHLATPIGLGIADAEGNQPVARRLMRAVITYLRHGMVYYHYFLRDVPEAGEGSGEYGPVNRMFPLTPVGLHKGWIEGRERIVTCVSGEYTWRGKAEPAVHLFDPDGREKVHGATLTQAGAGWRVQVTLRDWAEVAIIE